MTFYSLTTDQTYFNQEEADQRRELRAEAERRAAMEHEKRSHGPGLDTHRPALAERLHRLGLDEELQPVLHLLPLVETAWGDGVVSGEERDAIMQVAEAHGVPRGSEATRFLASMLEERPSDTWLEEIVIVLRELLHTQGFTPGSVIEACEQVAAASRGVLGEGQELSVEERAVLNLLSRSIDSASGGAVCHKLADPEDG